MESLYIHVPFCAKKCRYCDFYSTEYSDAIVNDYLRAIEKELQFYREHLNELQTVYIGGGTPSVLSEDNLGSLLKIVTKNVQFIRSGSMSHPGKDNHPPVSPLSKGGSEGGSYENGYEFTIEVNPRTINDTKTDILKRYGVNRVSIGVQSLDDGLLSFLGRIHNEEQAKEALKLISNNFDNYSVDLIYGIPAQMGELWEETLRTVLSYKPPHISAYELTPERETPLFKDIDTGNVTMPDEDSILRMYEKCSSVLTDKGYRHYEISSYARPGYESRHNMNYWRRGEYIGIGPSAHSFLDGKRFKNVTDVSDYCRKLESGVAPLEEVIELSPADEIKEIIMLGLRTREGIDLADILHRQKSIKGKAIDSSPVSERLSAFRESGSVDLDGDHVRLTDRGFALSNALIVEIMEALSV